MDQFTAWRWVSLCGCGWLVIRARVESSALTADLRKNLIGTVQFKQHEKQWRPARNVGAMHSIFHAKYDSRIASGLCGSGTLPQACSFGLNVCVHLLSSGNLAVFVAGVLFACRLQTEKTALVTVALTGW